LLKELTRRKEKITKEHLHEFIQTLNVKNEVREELLRLTPGTYTGIRL